MRLRFIALLLFVMVIGAGAAFLLTPHMQRLAARAPQQASPKASPVSIPLFFEPNQGQTDPQVKFLARGSGYGIFLTANEAVLKLQPTDVSHQPSVHTQTPSVASVIRMKLDGANANAAIAGDEQLSGKSNYFIGNDPSKWHRGVPQFARVEYKAVYPGIDLVYYGHQGHLEYDFHVAPSADPRQIVLNFDGADARIDTGDLVLSTGRGEVRFHAPHIYQKKDNAQQDVAGGFRQLAENKIGFSVTQYDHSRELIIDPQLSYSTYIGGSNTESSAFVAVGADNNIYLAGSTVSSDFPVTSPNLQGLTGTQNIFLAVLNPALTGTSQLLYATYLGGSSTNTAAGVVVDTAAGVAVTPHIDASTSGYDIYVAGSTTSNDFPTSTVLAPFQGSPTSTDTNPHSFVSRLNVAGNQLSYSTYLIGNGVDTVTGLAVDSTGDAFVTGTTTSTDSASGFPSTLNAFQPCPFQPPSVGTTCGVATGPTQFFVSKINTAGAGPQSMLYSTYFGGGWTAGEFNTPPTPEKINGGGIAVDTSGNIYFTGGTNMPAVQGPNPTNYPFPTIRAQQSCLNESSKTVCSSGQNPPPQEDAFVAKINPNSPGEAPVFSTYLGAEGDDIGYGVAVDGSGNAYVTGSTTSTQWVVPTSVTPLQSTNAGGQDAFIIKIVNPGSGSGVFLPVYFTYLGGSGTDTGQAIAVDSNQGAHVVGSSDSATLPAATNGNSGLNDAFIAFVSTTVGFGTGTGSGDYTMFLGGSGQDQGMGIALDANNVTYVSGTTTSSGPTAPPAFPTVNPYQGALNGGAADAFVAKLSPSSLLTVAVPTDSSGKPTSPSPNPVAAGNQVAFTFDIVNGGPDPATTVVFVVSFPATGLASQSAKITSGGAGSCGPVVAGATTSTITCTINSLSVHTGSGTTGVGVGTVELDLTPTVPVVNPVISPVSGEVFSANGVLVGSSVSQPPANVTDFSVSATPPQQTVTAGQNTSFNVTLTPGALGYTSSVSMSDSGLPTNSTAAYTTTPVALSGTGTGTTTLNVSTQPRPATTGSLFRQRMFFATWLPVGGLSLLGLGIGASRKRRLWLAGALLGLIAGILLVQPGCGSTSSAANNGGTPAGTYTVTITATSGSVSHTTTVRLVVN